MANPKKNIRYQTGRTYLRKKTPKQVETKVRATTIRKVERGEKAGTNVQQLRITTENGTICTISEKDENFRHESERWSVVWNYLAEGDLIEIRYWTNKILGSYIPVTQTTYQLGCCFMKDNALRLCFEAKEDKLVEPVDIAKGKNTTTSAIWLSEVFFEGQRYIGTLEELEKELDDAANVKVTVSSIGERKVRVDLKITKVNIRTCFRNGGIIATGGQTLSIKKVEEDQKDGAQRLKMITTTGTTCVISKDDEGFGNNSDYCWKLIYDCFAESNSIKVHYGSVGSLIHVYTKNGMFLFSAKERQFEMRKDEEINLSFVTSALQ